MAKPFDGIALQAYFRRQNFPRETQELLMHIRNSPPSRTPGARHGNMPVWYPSKKMQCIIKAESAKVEFAFLLVAEHDDAIVEVWDQPPPIPLEYPDQRGRWQRPMHTADYFIFGRQECGWIECKPTEELFKQAETRPHRYVRDEQGIWHCPPGETFAAKYGLTYRVWSSDQINWVAQDNALYLEDYYQDLERLQIPNETLEILQRLVSERPASMLADLLLAVMDEGISADLIHIAIARHDLYVDLASYRLSEPQHTPVFLRKGAVPVTVSLPLNNPDVVSLVTSAVSSLTSEGQTLLECASERDLETALFRNRVIHPEHYDDEEQERRTQERTAVPERTRQYWQQQYREAEVTYGSGFIGLLPRYHQCGGNRKIAPSTIALIHQVLETHYDTVRRSPKRGAYGEYLKRAEEEALKPVSQWTFYLESKRHKALYEQTLAREGARAAYPFKDYTRESEQTVNRHGNYAWALAHLDHTELDLVLCDSRTGQVLGKCWLTLLILAHPRRIAAFYLTFDPPSYRSCMMTLRLCVKRYGRMPSAIVVDGGPEFQSVYFEQLLALYRVRKQQRPASEPRFGSPQERLFGSMETEFLYHLLGNTQATRKPRQMVKATDPERLAVWTLPDLAERVQQWADEEYDTLRHPALGMTPRQAYELSIKRDGQRLHKAISYDETFRLTTFPTTRKGTSLVRPGVGVRINHLDYWCEAMRDPTIENTQVKVRYDPFDVSVGYAYIDRKWRKCDCPYNEFARCSERELQLLTEELRKRHRMTTGRTQTEITQKQLAAFRRDNTEIEAILRQQRHDRETRAALVVLEGGKNLQTVPLTQTLDTERSESLPPAESSEQPKKINPYENLLVLRKIEL
jgi:putative transposase